MFQCKRVRKITKAEISSELANFEGKRIDTWVLLCPIEPTPALRRWFEELEASARYRFHVEAWWLHDLDRLLVDCAGRLAKYLPVRIVEVLGVPARLAVNGSLEALSARLRDNAEAQIVRFAASKFIPRLYVKRDAQDKVVQFLGPERTSIERFRNSAKSALANASQNADTLESAFLERRASLQRSIARLRNKDERREREIELSLVDQFELQVREAADRIRTVVARAHGALDALPADGYLRKDSEYAVFVADVESATASLATPTVTTAEPHSGQTDSECQDLQTDCREVGFLVGELRSKQAAARDSLLGLRRLVHELFATGLALIDRAGGGKTNLVCHLATDLAQQLPVLITFGKENLHGHNSLVESAELTLSGALSCDRSTVRDSVDALLESDGGFLVVFVDGINENRRLNDFDEALDGLIRWAEGHRVRVVLTCRDIYWEFFTFHREQTRVRVSRDELKQFALHEYRSALPLYLAHYNIECEQSEEAERACHHPLLLRFFCEAYGNIDGVTVRLGTIQDIRLKELFDEYLERKGDQIRTRLGHHNADAVSDYLTRVVEHLFVGGATSLTTDELVATTGDADTSSTSSLYLQLLDEDIILEERPEDTYGRRVSFVYEEFMEYVLARAIVTDPSRFGASTAQAAFMLLDGALERWVNARGVGEYVALMLLSSISRREEAIAFLECLATGRKSWNSAFWSVIGKCSPDHLDSAVFDECMRAVQALTKRRSALLPVRSALASLARASSDAAASLAAVILWSLALPEGLGWAELQRLGGLRRDESEELWQRLCISVPKQDWGYDEPTLSLERVLEWFTPYLGPAARQVVDKAIRSVGGPLGDGSARSLIRILWKAFPEFRPLLVNGLLSEDTRLRAFCADRLRFVESARDQVAWLCEVVAASEHDLEVRDILRVTVARLTD